ncbi:MAG: DUF4255 domain-containing protein [Gammaproteobacteria bacterium]|nr:DUF4255 domain-containing protein [Gammaproteobacteria bacterium]
MSNYLAIATVTAALREHLTPAVKDAVSGAKVTLARPHKAPDVSSDESPLVNLYLYQVTPNVALRNIDLPTRSNNGTLYQRPRTGVDLHYLMTFYGDQKKLEPECLLGAVIKTLHAQPVMHRALVAQLVADTTNYPMLADSDLQHAVDLVKFTPISYSLEELSKLWSVFLQTPYTLSAAYIGTAVVIEASSAPASALPVRSRRLYVETLRQPSVDRVQAVGDDATRFIEADTSIVIYGRQLKGTVTRLRLGAAELIPSLIEDLKIEMNLADAPADVVRSGAQTLTVLHYVGPTSDLRIAAESIAVAVIVHPRLKAIAVDDVVIREDGLRDATLSIDVVPTLASGQRISVLMNSYSAATTPSYSFTLAPPASDTAHLVINVTGVAAGEYLLRIQVDGAMSALGTDIAGRYATPKLVMP